MSVRRKAVAKGPPRSRSKDAAKAPPTSRPRAATTRGAKRRATQNEVRAWALALPEAQEGAHMGHADLRVRGKIFASLPNDARFVNMKSTPTNLDALVRAAPDVFRDVWAGRWIGVRLDAADADEVHELLKDAWRLTAPKSLIATLDAPPAASARSAGRVRRPRTR